MYCCRNGNEHADQLAKAASFKSYVGPELVLPVPISVVQSQLQTRTLREHKLAGKILNHAGKQKKQLMV